VSENFETGLNELYTRAAAAHSDAGGFPTTAMVAVARRNRRARTAAVAVVTAAAVVGGGFGGAAAVRNLGDGVAQPAETGTPTVTGSVLDPECGTPIADLKVAHVEGISFDGELESAAVALGSSLTAWIDLSLSAGPVADFELPYPNQYPNDVTFLVVRDGVVVGLGDAALIPGPGDDRGQRLLTTPNACDADIDMYPAPLEPGSYELRAVVTVLFTETGTHALLLGSGMPFTVGDDPDTEPTEAPTPDSEPTADPAAIDPEDLTHDVSALFTDGAPLEDGDYFAALLGVDAAGATIDVDLMVSYWGPAAEEYVAANAPGEEVLNDYYVVNDVEQGTTLPLAADAPVFENCFDEDAPGYFPRTVAEWASAPTSWDGLPYGPTDCSAGAELGHTTYYWLRIRDGVVVGVVGQWVP